MHTNSICLLKTIVFERVQALFLKAPYRCIRIFDIICHHQSYAFLRGVFIYLYSYKRSYWLKVCIGHSVLQNFIQRLWDGKWTLFCLHQLSLISGSLLVNHKSCSPQLYRRRYRKCPNLSYWFWTLSDTTRQNHFYRRLFLLQGM